MCMSISARGHCYVQTALVSAAGPRGERGVRVLIDGGSDASFIRSSLADDLGLEPVGRGTFAVVGFKEKAEEAVEYDQVRTHLTGFRRGEADLTFWKTEKLCVPVRAEPPVLCLPPSVELADDFREGPVDLLIGCDQLFKVLLWDQVEVTRGLRLIETVFGYVLHGHTPGQQQSARRRVYRCQTVGQMWSLDAVGVAADEVRETAVVDTPSLNSDGRYEMSLLWKSDRRPLSNLQSAEARTSKMASRLSTDQYLEYDQHMTSLLDSAVIELSPPEGESRGSDSVGESAPAPSRSPPVLECKVPDSWVPRAGAGMPVSSAMRAASPICIENGASISGRWRMV